MVDTDKYKAAFDLVDGDDDGLISPAELKNMMAALGDDVSDAQAEEMVRKIDGDGDDRISLEEFAAFMDRS